MHSIWHQMMVGKVWDQNHFILVGFALSQVWWRGTVGLLGGKICEKLKVVVFETWWVECTPYGTK